MTVSLSCRLFQINLSVKLTVPDQGSRESALLSAEGRQNLTRIARSQQPGVGLFIQRRAVSMILFITSHHFDGQVAREIGPQR